jgi:carbon-monoxide dehydrogenase medium subunit
MHAFAYARPATLDEAVALLDAHGPEARALAGGTDLIIRLRDGTLAPAVVVDVKGIPELQPGIRVADGRLEIGATTVMSEIAADARVLRDFRALAEAAAVVGSVQIRNRATLAGNICNASPAADTAPSLLVYGAAVVAAGPAVHLRRTRRRGHDLASVTLCCGVDEIGVTRLAYGSVGPRPVLEVDASGILADPAVQADAKASILERMLAAASPSPRSMRASPEYRLAMLRVLATRALGIAIDRLAGQRMGA